MSARTLVEIKAAVEQLDLPEQVRLLEYLTPNVARAVLSGPHAAGADDAAWRRYRSPGERLAATSVNGAPCLTEAISQMRR